MSGWTCPCLSCARCGWSDDPDEFSHPLDGDWSCPRCRRAFKWVAIGPHMDGRHPKDEDDWHAWNDYDTSMMR